MLTESQIDFVVDLANKKLDLPVLGEKPERAIIKFAIKKVDFVLDQELPPEWKDFLNTTSDGIVPGGEEDFNTVIAGMTSFVNKKVNLPIVGEELEHLVFEEILRCIFEALKKGKSLGSV